jgi:hypothetical protein
MSIFYADPPKEQPKKQEDMTAFAIGAAVLVIAAVLYQKMALLKRFYFQQFEVIWLCAFGGVALIAILGIYFVVRRTKPLIERRDLLAGASEFDDSIFVGWSKDGVALYVSEKDRSGHVQLLGSTGRGKTKSVIEPWIYRDILARRSVVLIDGKGDPAILQSIRTAANKSNRLPEVFVFDLGNPESSCAINPLEYGSAQQITDRLFTAFTFDNQYYRSVQYDVTSTLVELIKEMEEVVTFRRLHELLTDDLILSELMAKSQNAALKKKLTQYLSTPKNTREEKFSGVISQLAPFAVGEVSPLVNGATTEKPVAFSPSRILIPTERDVEYLYQYVFVALIPTLKYQQIGHQLGKLLCQEIGWAVGERASRMGDTADFVPVYLDEFSAFVYEGFTNILNKARSSRVGLHLSHQTLADLGVVSPEFAQIITTNTNVKCILGLNDPESADFMARHMGTETQEKLTEQANQKGFFPTTEKTGAVSIREVEAYKVHPNSLKNFMNGRGVLHLPSERGNITEEIQFVALTKAELNGKEVRNEDID